MQKSLKLELHNKIDFLFYALIIYNIKTVYHSQKQFELDVYHKFKVINKKNFQDHLHLKFSSKKRVKNYLEALKVIGLELNILPYLKREDNFSKRSIFSLSNRVYNYFLGRSIYAYKIERKYVCKDKKCK